MSVFNKLKEKTGVIRQDQGKRGDAVGHKINPYLTLRHVATGSIKGSLLASCTTSFLLRCYLIIETDALEAKPLGYCSEDHKVKSQSLLDSCHGPYLSTI